VSRPPNVERMAEGIIRLSMELQRRKEAGPSTHELTTTQALVLRVAVLEGPQRIGAIASELGVTVATASRTVDALVAANLVRREADSTDARAVRVVATAQGKREFRLRRDRFARALARLSDDLSETEQRQLADALETLGRLFGADPAQTLAGAGRPKS
jgi:MarR family transcriptional regulator, 2-MHQ and catechol-resistance regulon repressor